MKLIYSKKIIFVIALTFLSTNIFAVEKANRNSVEELLNIMNMQSMLDDMYSNIDKTFATMAESFGIEEDEKPILKKYTSKMTALMKKEMTWEKMKEQYIDIYVSHYTEKEVQDMIKFYKSDTGKSIMKKMPKVMKESMLVGQKMSGKFIPKIQNISKEMAKELVIYRQKKKR